MPRRGSDHLLVVAAVIRDDQGRLLVAQRPNGRHLAGLWEFPGGAVERGELPEEALARELDEEVGIEVAVGEPLTFAWHRANGRPILLLFYSARITGGSVRGREGQAVRWVTPAQLRALPTPPADAVLIRQLGGD